uniref:cell envelope integrity protein TolA n=1 Tax=Sutterella wadsworthensis TaxID=40545 RepID=UPI001F0D8A8B
PACAERTAATSPGMSVGCISLPARSEKAQEAQRIEEEQIARAAQEELEARRQEAERIAQERARAEEIERMRQEAIEAEQRRLAEEARREEEERIAQERLAEQAKRAEEERQAEEARRQEAARLAEEARKAEEAKKAEEERRAAEAEAKRIAEELKREEAERQAQEAAQKAAAERQAREAEQAKRRIAQQARERELARLAAKIDPNAQRSGTTRGDQRNFRRSLTGSALATWSNRVRACIRPNILFDVPVNTPRGRYVAEYQVRLQSDGKQIGSPELKKSSGLSAYDTNVLRAIRLCNPFPQPTGGEAIPSVLTITFDPVDDTAGK